MLRSTNFKKLHNPSTSFHFYTKASDDFFFPIILYKFNLCGNYELKPLPQQY
eukprot:m.134345 g.134345  ORF g.134345 m.134345 type:complete len:52 (-) comp9556_c0_seq1:70-225(-)